MLSSFRRMRTMVLTMLACLMGICIWGGSAYAEGNPSSYNYNFWGDTVASPNAYQATTVWNGNRLGVGAFKDPNDLHVTADHHIYVLDSGNNRVVILDSNGNRIRIIDSFVRDGKTDTFSNPLGLFVTEDKQLYVADTGNGRVVHLDANDKLVKIIDHPESELLQADFKFQPARVVVDKAKRVYVMSTGVFDGFMEFSAEGTFDSFIGANRVMVNPTEYFWKMLSTKAQRSQMVMFTPTEFTNLDMNDEGFIYATNGQRNDNVRKLNAQGTDILRRTGYFPPEGDIRFTRADGPTRLVDIDITDSEMYSILDASRGRVFTYNGDGYLMYVFGGLGNQLGQFSTPVAIEHVGDDFLVLDKSLGEITVFQTTDYGRTLNEAVRSYYKGDEEKAYQLFQKTINMNANLDFAYTGIGKALLRQGKYAEAMKYFKRSEDRADYSKAFLLYRKEVMRTYFPTIMTGLVVLAALAVVWRRYRRNKGRKKGFSIEHRAV